MVGFYVVDDPRSGPANMATDQFMLERSAAEGIPLVRFYQWLRPTLSLGYFQKLDDRQQHPPSQKIDIVRRATGGGAIVHHYDWTYAVSIPEALLGTRKSTASCIGASQRLYDSVHAAIVHWLRQQGWDARMWNATCEATSAARLGCSFLCFERRSKGDIVVHDAKVMGSAQRRLPDAILQHGSLLLKRSPHAPTLLGLQELPLASTHDHVGTPAVHQHLLHTAVEFQEQILSAIGALIDMPLQPLSSRHELLPNVDFDTDTRFSEASWTGRI